MAGTGCGVSVICSGCCESAPGEFRMAAFMQAPSHFIRRLVISHSRASTQKLASKIPFQILKEDLWQGETMKRAPMNSDRTAVRSVQQARVNPETHKGSLVSRTQPMPALMNWLNQISHWRRESLRE